MREDRRTIESIHKCMLRGYGCEFLFGGGGKGSRDVRRVANNNRFLSSWATKMHGCIIRR